MCIGDVHWGIGVSPPFPPAPLKNTTPLILAKSPLNQQTVQALLFFSLAALYICFFVTPPKSQIFQWTPKILKVFHP